MHRFVWAAIAATIAAALLAVAAASAAPPSKNHYVVTPLASDVPGLAPATDANLKNTWGLARGDATPWWIANNGTASTSVYNGAGTRVDIGGLPAQGVPGDPTGAVFSGITGQFQVGTTVSPTTLGASNFIFDGEDGTISAWRIGSTAALVTVPSSGAVYKGLAISNGSSGPRLYATDFAQGTGHSRVDVFDGSWNPVNTPGAFVDPRLPKHYGPFGIQTIGDQVFVTYAKQQHGSDDEAHGRGLGIVDVYDLDGKFLRRVAQHGQLNAPWGLAQAPGRSAASAATCWSATSATGRSTPTRRCGTAASSTAARSAPQSTASSRSTGSGHSSSATPARTATRTPCTSPPASTTRPTGSSARSQHSTDQGSGRGGVPSAAPPGQDGYNWAVFLHYLV